MDRRNAENDADRTHDTLISFEDGIRSKIERLRTKSDIHYQLAKDSISLASKTFHTKEFERLSCDIGKLKEKLRNMKRLGFTKIHRDIFSIEPFYKI